MSDDSQGEFDLFPYGSRRSHHGIARAFEPARLTQARVLAELTKAELADAIHVSAAAVGQYEAGVTAPRPELLPVLARELKVPAEFFAAGRPLGRLDAANAHFRSLRSTRAKDRAKAATYAEQVWELAHALEKRIRLPEAELPELPAGASPADAAQILRQRLERQPGTAGPPRRDNRGARHHRHAHPAHERGNHASECLFHGRSRQAHDHRDPRARHLDLPVSLYLRARTGPLAVHANPLPGTGSKSGKPTNSRRSY